MVLANKAAKDLKKDLINKAKDGEPVAVVIIGSELKQD
jgi:hypothetical protein